MLQLHLLCGHGESHCRKKTVRDIGLAKIGSLDPFHRLPHITDVVYVSGKDFYPKAFELFRPLIVRVANKGSDRKPELQQLFRRREPRISTFGDSHDQDPVRDS